MQITGLSMKTDFKLTNLVEEEIDGITNFPMR